MLDGKFAREAFEGSGEPERLALELEATLERRFAAAADCFDAIHELVDELRALGHPIYSFDESDDFAIWCDDWVSPSSPNELIIDFRFAEGAAREVEVSFGPRPRR